MAVDKRLRITLSIISKQLFKLSALFCSIITDLVTNDPTKLVGKTQLQINSTKLILLLVNNFQKIESLDAI
jgi:hypothetical protein